jgi:AmmeMemoRadiSam system protein A
MNELHRKILLDLARKTIAAKFSGKNYELGLIPKEFQARHGVFVTLHKHGELRGCIGYIHPIKPLYDGVKENALNAAFHDPRFPPLGKEELIEVEIELSVLTPPKRLEYKSEADLLKKLRSEIDGVIIEKNGRQATFLPQVWKQIQDKIEFLQQLCWKAGLSPDAWKTAAIYTYQAEVFSEK